jgi:hypothetical protein
MVGERLVLGEVVEVVEDGGARPPDGRRDGH